MKDRDWQIGVFGTFDVENYGDLLFPLLARWELTRRLGEVTFHAFSYREKRPPDWPYPVTSVTGLPQMASRLDGVLIGGGFIIRFDKEVAPGYGPPTPTIHHPTGYWLTPALIALQNGIPLIWNAPGMHRNPIPQWAEPLMEIAFTFSQYVAVRDEPSRAALARFAGDKEIAVLPDTGFGISRLLDDERPSAEFERLREAAGLTKPYIIVQAIGGLDDFQSFAKKHAWLLRDYQMLALPVGPVLGDDEAILGTGLPGLTRLPTWPRPLLMAELISHAAAVIGHSYHLMITALATGVPAFCSANLEAGKYTALAGFETIYPLPSLNDPQEFIARLGKAAPSPRARAACDQLDRHWDQIAEILRQGRIARPAALDHFWQWLPVLLESEGSRMTALTAERDAQQQRVDELAAQLAAIYDSPSWKATRPARFIMRNLKRMVGR